MTDCCRYPIPQDCIGWVIGRRFATLHEIADSANLNYARLEDTSHSPCLVLCGRRQDLDDAKLLLDSHLQYHDVFEDMAKESRELGDEFYRLNDVPDYQRRGKGKGKRHHRIRMGMNSSQVKVKGKARVVVVKGEVEEVDPLILRTQRVPAGPTDGKGRLVSEILLLVLRSGSK